MRTCFRISTLAIFLLVIIQASGARPSHASPIPAQSSRELSLSAIEKLIQEKREDRQIADLIKKRGVAFKVDEQIIKDLEIAGAGPETLKVLKNSLTNSTVKELGPLKFELVKCSRNSTTVTCRFLVTNVGETNDFASCRVYRQNRNDTTLFDEKSNQAFISGAKFSDKATYEQNIARDTSVPLEVEFQGVASDSRIAKVISLKFRISANRKSSLGKLSWNDIRLTN